LSLCQENNCKRYQLTHTTFIDPKNGEEKCKNRQNFAVFVVVNAGKILHLLIFFFSKFFWF